jgi:hypothetical protein
MNNDFRIDFVCVGAAKSGTTALHRFLRAHPQVYMPLKKEIHHFADDLLKADDYWLQPEAFWPLYKQAKTGQILGETSVFYMISENAALNIYAHNPDTKIIIMLRNPAEAAYSLYSQLVFNGEENIRDFREALKAEKERKAGNNLPVTRIIKKHFYTETFKYTQQVKRFLDVFPPEQVYIILFDDFKNKLPETLENLYDFLNIDKDFKPELKQHNANKSVRNRKLQKLSDKFSYKILARFLSPDTTEAFREFMLQINSKQQARKPLPPDVKQELRDIFKPDILALENLIKTDLSCWYRNT